MSIAKCTRCNGAIQPAESIEIRYQEKLYEFCSDECKIIFESAPENTGDRLTSSSTEGEDSVVE